MKKRLRKKYHLREFQEPYFSIRFKYTGAPYPVEEDLFWNDFILNCIEANGLNCCGGASDHIWEMGAHSVDKSQSIEDQRDAVRAWLESRNDVEEVSCGEFRDAWYDFPISLNDEMRKKPLQYFVQVVRNRDQSFHNDGNL